MEGAPTLPMSRRDPFESVVTLGPPPTYSTGGIPRQDEHPGCAQHPNNGGSSTSTIPSGPELRQYPYAMSNSSERRLLGDDSIVGNLLRLQKISEGRSSTTTTTATPTVAETESVSHISAAGGTYPPSLTNSQGDGENRRSPDLRSPSPADLQLPCKRERKITNNIHIVRKATPHPRIFSLFYPNPTIIDTFYIDPHLRIPGSVLSAVQSSSNRAHSAAAAATRRAEQQRDQRRARQPTNLSLELQDGKMNITIHLIADCDPISSSNRRLRSVNSLLHPSNTTRRSILSATLSTTRPKTFKAYPMLLRIHAPQPRPPFFLQATCVGPIDSVCRSPLTLHLPRSFHGPITVKIQVGNIDHHLWLSPTMRGVARMMSEDEKSRGYFVGALPDTMDEEEEESGDEPTNHGLTPQEEEEWQGDKVELEIGNGRLRLLFEDENLAGLAEISSEGWIWPAKWG